CLYHVCHNVSKEEDHIAGGRPRRLCVHRKGATRAFAPGHPALPPAFRRLGQPVIIPGDMGRHSFVLLGAAGAMAESFGTPCHGAGRLMSRAQAKKQGRGVDLVGTLAARGVTIRARSLSGIAEGMPWAYKDAAEGVDAVARGVTLRPGSLCGIAEEMRWANKEAAGVVDVVARAGLATLVARLSPMIV